jgi:adenylyl- and sulfurtransferase ThiI
VASFRVLTKRGDKTFPLTSPEVSRRLGARVKEATGARVDLDVAVQVRDVEQFLDVVGGDVALLLQLCNRPLGGRVTVRVVLDRSLADDGLCLWRNV